MNRQERTSRNREFVLDYIGSNEGCTKEEMKEKFGLSRCQLNVIISSLKDEIRLVLIGGQKTRIGTYYINDGEEPSARYQMKPTIDGARIINAGDILRKKYGYKSPELKKREFKGIGSAMGGIEE